MIHVIFYIALPQHCLTEATKRCLDCLTSITKPKEKVEDHHQESHDLHTKSDHATGTASYGEERKWTEDKTETYADQTASKSVQPVATGAAASRQKRVATLKEIAEAAKSKVGAEDTTVMKTKEIVTTRPESPAADEKDGKGGRWHTCYIGL